MEPLPDDEFEATESQLPSPWGESPRERRSLFRGRSSDLVFGTAIFAIILLEIWLVVKIGWLDPSVPAPAQAMETKAPASTNPPSAAPAKSVVRTSKLEAEDKTAVSFKGQTFFSVLLKADEVALNLYHSDETGERYASLDRLEEALKADGKRILFATNSGMFKPGHAPVGLHVEGGKELYPLDSRTEEPGNFYLMPNGVFFLDSEGLPGLLTTEQFMNQSPKDLRLATQSGPMLVIDGKVHPKFNPVSTNRYVRSGVGIRGGGEIVFAMSAQPVTLHEFASFFLEHHTCPAALYLDGAISHFHAPSLGHDDLGGDFGGILTVTEQISE